MTVLHYVYLFICANVPLCIMNMRFKQRWMSSRQRRGPGIWRERCPPSTSESHRETANGPQQQRHKSESARCNLLCFSRAAFYQSDQRESLYMLTELSPTTRRITWLRVETFCAQSAGACACVPRLTETALGAEQDSAWLRDKGSDRPVQVPLAAVNLEVTPVRVAMPTLPSGESDKEGDTVSPYDFSQMEVTKWRVYSMSGQILSTSEDNMSLSDTPIWLH